MPNFALMEWVVVLIICAIIGVAVILLPWIVAGFIKSIKRYL